MEDMLTNDEILLFLSGQPVCLKMCNIFVVQPTIKEIALFGEEDFLSAVQIISNLKKVISPLKQGNSELEIYDDFTIFLAVIEQDKKLKKQIQVLFNLIFPDYDYNITSHEIEFKLKDSEDVIGIITSFSFADFQRVIKGLFGISSNNKEDERDYNPANEKAKEIMEKIMKGRQKKQEEQSKEIGSLYGNYVSVLSLGMNIDINKLLEYTPFQLIDGYKRFHIKNNYEYYKRIASMPMMDVSKIDEPENWFGNLYKPKDGK